MLCGVLYLEYMSITPDHAYIPRREAPNSSSTHCMCGPLLEDGGVTHGTGVGTQLLPLECQGHFVPVCGTSQPN